LAEVNAKLSASSKETVLASYIENKARRPRSNQSTPRQVFVAIKSMMSRMPQPHSEQASIRQLDKPVDCTDTAAVASETKTSPVGLDDF